MPPLPCGFVPEVPTAGSTVLYARGSLLTPEPHNPPLPDLTYEKLGSWHISFDSRMPYGASASEESMVAVLGHVFEFSSGTSSNAEVASLLARVLRYTPDTFQWLLDRLAGRYVVVYGYSDLSALQQDATGMRSVFYSRDGSVIASHPHLGASVTEEEPVQPARGPRPAGLRTPYPGVLHLTPNTELMLSTMRPNRVFPRAELTPITVAEAAESILEKTHSYARHLFNEHEVAVSLSAGIDSRTTLACLREIIDRGVTFTYDLRGGQASINRQLSTDRVLAREMAEPSASHTG
jgi:asparagine synthetase B (glutamine-hydrolysing)